MPGVEKELPSSARQISRGGTVGSGAVVIAYAFLIYTILMALFCVFIGSRTSWRMGWLISVPVIFAPWGLVLIGFAVY
ncbi:hypothetical protein [Streptomyces sp. CoH27]|uniref:hypothetical protein n=1 Tax=Streptomyces sp. CoH27 TaxID=2875763 RepID=UPI001CD73E51|nr:hypothetical protein [Streptomyces sp. CoH27]